MVLSGRAALCDPLRGGCEGAARGLPAPGGPVGDGVTPLGSLARCGLVAGLCCLVSASGAVLPCVLCGVSVLPRLSLPHPTGGCWWRSKARLRLLCAHPEPTAVVGMGVEREAVPGQHRSGTEHPPSSVWSLPALPITVLPVPAPLLWGGLCSLPAVTY